jgi:hypothetical protein
MIRTLPAVIVALLFFSYVGPAAGQDRITTVFVNASGNVSTDQEQPIWGAFAAQAVPITDFSMHPSVTSTTRGAGFSRMTLVYICRDASNQNVNCSINLVATAVAGSGGHDHHDNNRPKGTLSNVSGFTGTGGFSTIYTAPETGGVVELQVNLVFPPVPPATEGQPFSFVQTFGITVPGLLPLPPGNWTPIGAVPGQHTDNHYGLPTMNESVLLFADEYRQVFGEMLALNDMSLVQGGLFDVFGTNPSAVWKPNHFSHRFGDDIDVRLPPRERRLRFLDMALRFELERVIERGRLTHYHLRLR